MGQEIFRPMTSCLYCPVCPEAHILASPLHWTWKTCLQLWTVAIPHRSCISQTSYSGRFESYFWKTLWGTVYIMDMSVTSLCSRIDAS